jgi:hypothetical protein
LNFISSLPLGVLKQVKKINALSGGKKKREYWVNLASDSRR